jgi:hypothetical protein
MADTINVRVVLGSLRYKTSTDTSLSIPTPLIQNSKNLHEFDRSVEVNLEQVFNDERQKSTIFRPTCKFQVLFNNSYTGSTNYVPLENNLYYINETQSALKQCGKNPNDVRWEGFVQSSEFDFIRTDYNVNGYTQPPNNHINFIAKSASTYNWNHFVSYPYKNINKTMSYTEFTSSSFPNTVIWNAIDGIPFIVATEDSEGNKLTEAGNGIIQFKCPVKHGLYVGEFVKLNIGGNDVGTFQVYSLGNGVSGMGEYVFNLFDIGYTPPKFVNRNSGTFKRIINDENPQDSISKYYVIQHKIITNVEDYVLVNAGFENNIFGTTKKYASSGFTPNNVSRTSIKENSQSYTLSFNKDIDISQLRDNNKKPISELFITTAWRGYFGLTFGLETPGQGYLGLKEGWEFNLPLKNNNTPNSWWDLTNSDSNFVNENNQPYPTNPFPIINDLSLGLGPGNGTIPFRNMEPLKDGDVLDGGFYEWNELEQKERLISDIYHKFTFNPFVFNLSDNDNNRNQLGYYYQPHNKIKIRGFSDYIETGSINNMSSVPDYSYFSTTYNSFIWRDLYTYGFKDNSGNGVDYPFLNGKHYPYENFIFRIIPEGTNYIESSLNNYATLYGAAQPTKDDCE